MRIMMMMSYLFHTHPSFRFSRSVCACFCLSASLHMFLCLVKNLHVQTSIRYHLITSLFSNCNLDVDLFDPLTFLGSNTISRPWCRKQTGIVMVPSCLTAFGKIVDPTDVLLSLCFSSFFYLKSLTMPANTHTHPYIRSKTRGVWSVAPGRYPTPSIP